MLLNCLLTAAICALLSAIAVFWISMSYEGHGSDAIMARTLAMVLVPLAGGLVGLVIGAVGSSLLPRPTYLKLLGVGAAVTAVAGMGSIAFVWVSSDREPTLGGKLLDVEFELKTPSGVPRPDPFSPPPRLLPYGGDLNVGDFALDLTHVSGGEGGWIIHDFFPLKTRRAERSLHIAWAPDLQLHFPIDGAVSESGFQWSPWIAATNAGNFQLRYKLRPRTQLVKTEPDQNVLEAQAIAALAPDAPIKEWMKHLRYDLPEEPRNQIAAVLERRQAELVAMIVSGDAAQREQALTAVRYLNASAPELNAAVLGEGRAIADAIQEFNAMSAEDPQFPARATELSSRFDDWRTAWWAIHNWRANFDATPLRDIHRLSKRHASTSALRDVELNARVILERLDTKGTAPRE